MSTTNSVLLGYHHHLHLKYQLLLVIKKTIYSKQLLVLVVLLWHACQPPPKSSTLPMSRIKVFTSSVNPDMKQASRKYLGMSASKTNSTSNIRKINQDLSMLNKDSKSWSWCGDGHWQPTTMKSKDKDWLLDFHLSTTTKSPVMIPYAVTGKFG